MAVKNINTDNFVIKTHSGFDSGAKFSEVLAGVLISNPVIAKAHRKLSGHVHIPVVNDKTGKIRTMKMNDDLSSRAIAMYQLTSYLNSTGARGDEFTEVVISYTGSIQQEWEDYLSILIDFIDYILPFLSRKAPKDVTIKNLIMADHIWPNDRLICIHILYTANEKTEFIQIWNLYLKYLQKIESKKSEGEK